MAPLPSEELRCCTMDQNLTRCLFRSKSSKTLRRGVHVKCKISSVSSCRPHFLGDCVDAHLAWKLTCVKNPCLSLRHQVVGEFAVVAQLGAAFPVPVAGLAKEVTVCWLERAATSHVLAPAPALAPLCCVILCKARSCAWP